MQRCTAANSHIAQISEPLTSAWMHHDSALGFSNDQAKQQNRSLMKSMEYSLKLWKSYEVDLEFILPHILS